MCPTDPGDPALEVDTVDVVFDDPAASIALDDSVVDRSWRLLPAATWHRSRVTRFRRHRKMARLDTPKRRSGAGRLVVVPG